MHRTNTNNKNAQQTQTTRMHNKHKQTKVHKTDQEQNKVKTQRRNCDSVQITGSSFIGASASLIIEATQTQDSIPTLTIPVPPTRSNLTRNKTTQDNGYISPRVQKLQTI